jgi:hypothetical protein
MSRKRSRLSKAVIHEDADFEYWNDVRTDLVVQHKIPKNDATLAIKKYRERERNHALFITEILATETANIIAKHEIEFKKKTVKQPIMNRDTVLADMERAGRICEQDDFTDADRALAVRVTEVALAYCKGRGKEFNLVTARLTEDLRYLTRRK